MTAMLGLGLPPCHRLSRRAGKCRVFAKFAGAASIKELNLAVLRAQRLPHRLHSIPNTAKLPFQGSMSDSADIAN